MNRSDKKRVLVLGLGALGMSLVETLWDSDEVEVIAVDDSDELVDRVKTQTAACYVGDVTSENMLESIRARDADCAVVTFGEHFEASVLAVATLKKLGVREIVARAITSRQAEILRTIGATRVLEVEREMGARLAVELTTIASSEMLDFAHGYRVVPWAAEGKLVCKTLAEAALRARYDVTVLGVRRDGLPGHAAEAKRLTPTGADYVISAGDTLMVVGDEQAIGRFLAEQ